MAKRPTVIDLDSPRSSGGPGFPPILWLLLLFFVLGSARGIARFWIDYEWWREMHQLDTWSQMLLVSVLPSALAGVLMFLVLWMLYARASRGAAFPGWMRWIPPLALLAFSVVISNGIVEDWTFARWWGASQNTTPDSWRDPSFGQPLSFYFFSLPLFSMVISWLQTLLVSGALLYWITSSFQSLRYRFQDLQEGNTIDIRDLRLGEAFNSMPLRIALAFFLLLMAAGFYLGRYDLLFEDHGFMVGADYVASNISLPLIWLKVGAAALAAVLVLARRVAVGALVLVASLVVSGIIPQAVNAISVRPNEISLQKPFIKQHIEATRAAYGLTSSLSERDFPVQSGGAFEPAKHQSLLENVRLWDWQAFHDTITQIQALRPYYVFNDTDVDRYRFTDDKGVSRVRQVLLTPRELDVNQLPDARTRWINPHFIYTHGYGMVMAEANRISSDGLPSLLVKNAPLEVAPGTVKVTRPEIYYGEKVHEPVFVRTEQPEFNYPSGNENVHTKYEGAGGIPIKGGLMRLAAAVAEGDWNILLTGYFTTESRMLIKRNVAARVDTLASFIRWDEDPYLIVNKEGRLVWMIDGYTTHSRHPYSRMLNVRGEERLNYIRNSVKATVDAYDGQVHLYAFDAKDPILAAYRKIFPQLFEDADKMPADLREHARYPETLFRFQAHMYRTFHMKDPEAFYNKEDLWDLAQTSTAQENSAAEDSRPTYVMATLPGQKEAEFLLLTTFTPRKKQNLVALMAARCDGTRLGELEVLTLSKQQLIYGPMQVSARINQDQNISKDLTLWNQQGSRVIKGQMLVLPIGEQFIYVQPIYIQASQAPMPELRKVAVGFGNAIAYADTYEQALGQLAGSSVSMSKLLESAPAGAIPATPNGSTSVAAPPTTQSLRQDSQMERVRMHLKRYKEYTGQGRLAEAGKELEAIEAELK